MLMHTEYTLLSLLEHEEGVIRHRGMFSVSISSKNDDFLSARFSRLSFSKQECDAFTTKLTNTETKCFVVG